MRWFKVRKARIASNVRDALEQAGTSMVQTLMFSGMINSADLPDVLKRIASSSEERRAALAWLTEKTDRAERVETWNLAMEAAITVFVLFSLIVDVALLRKG